MSPTIEVLFIFVMLALSACFSAMETALVSLGELRTRRLCEEPRPSGMLVRWRDRPNDVLATLLIGNNFVNITASALATDATEAALEGTAYGGWGIPIAVGVTTMVVLIAGEVVPKTFAKHNPEHVLRVLPILSVTWFLFYPVMRVLVRLTGRIVRRLGGATEGASNITDDDIAEMVRIGSTDGSVSPEAARILTGVFDMDQKVAREVMVPRTEVHALPADAGLAEVMAAVKRHGHSRFPVYRETIDDIVGVLYVKDYFQAVIGRELGDLAKAPRAGDVVRKPLVRPWNIGIQDLFHDMQRERVHLAVLASEYGGVAGIATLEDIIEEVFGPIYDEHDPLAEAIRETPDGAWYVDGLASMSDLERVLGVSFDGDEANFETVAGLVMREAGRVPEAGYVVERRGYRFEVTTADAMQVRQVMVRRIGEPHAVADELRAVG